MLPRHPIPDAMLLALLFFAIGMLLSGFFSGSETGFYRISRARLVLDGLDGDLVARGLVVLSNHASVFVSTVLVGNNLANYVTSAAIVVGTQALYGDARVWPQIVAPLVFAPFVFLYGELLPKNLFYDAPNRLLKWCGTPLLISAILFLPVTLVLWSVSRALQWISGESPERVQLALARRELQRFFEEGHEAGLLRSAQRELAQGLMGVAGRPVTEFVTPPGRVPRIHRGASGAEIRRLARRQRLSVVAVEDVGDGRRLVGYVRTADLYLAPPESEPTLRRLVEIDAGSTHLDALLRMEASGEMLGQVVDDQRRTVGFVTTRQLAAPLYQAG